MTWEWDSELTYLTSRSLNPTEALLKWYRWNNDIIVHRNVSLWTFPYAILVDTPNPSSDAMKGGCLGHRQFLLRQTFFCQKKWHADHTLSLQSSCMDICVMSAGSEMSAGSKSLKQTAPVHHSLMMSTSWSLWIISLARTQTLGDVASDRRTTGTAEGFIFGPDKCIWQDCRKMTQITAVTPQQPSSHKWTMSWL